MRISKIVKTIVRITATVIVVGLAGCCSAGIIFGLAFYFNETFLRIETARDWAGFMAMMGVFTGFGPGVIIGLTVGITRPTNSNATIIGAVGGLLITAAILISPEPSYPLIRLFSLPACTFIGMITGIVVRSIDRFQIQSKMHPGNSPS